MSEILIPRTGMPSLHLVGWTQVASVTSRTAEGPRSSRWHELELWCFQRGRPVEPPTCDDSELAVGALCVAIHYRTTWAGELDHHAAFTRDVSQVAAALRDHDPCANVMGYPPGAQFAERQARLLRELRAGYEHAVSRLLEAAGIVDEPQTQSAGLAPGANGLAELFRTRPVDSEPNRGCGSASPGPFEGANHLSP
jgi:hypothetical protein